MGLFDFLGFGKKKKRIEDMMQRGALVVDVRSEAEFSRGNVSGSINVPLDRIRSKANKLKKMNKPLILCCASGMRSASATQILQSEGIECMNGGGWRSLT